MRLLDSMIALAILVMVTLAVAGLFGAMARSGEGADARETKALAAYVEAERAFADAGR